MREIDIKIQKMRLGGKILGEVMDHLVKVIKPQMREIDIENIANDLIIKKGGKPAFKKVPGYNYATCISVDDEVVHGIPGETSLKEKNLVGIDCGVFLDGFYTDMAETILLGKDSKIEAFLSVGKKALYEAIKEAKAGNRVGHISSKIQEIVEGSGYSVVRNLVGHGVGRKLHEKPDIPGFLNGKIEDTMLLKSGMTIAIEVIYNMGKKEVVYRGDDDWTIVSEDASLSSTFERTIVIRDEGPEILTNLKQDKGKYLL